MRKISDTKGLSRIVVLAIVIAIALIVVLAVKIFNNKSQQALRDIDDQIVITAEREARLFRVQDDIKKEIVYDALNKTFVDAKEARTKVEPYGSAKENQGKYLLITFGEDDEIISKWVKP